jgi:hypothetical protein
LGIEKGDEDVYRKIGRGAVRGTRGGFTDGGIGGWLKRCEKMQTFMGISKTWVAERDKRGWSLKF